MNCGPFRFQCACLVMSAKSIPSASRALSMSIDAFLALSGVLLVVRCLWMAMSVLSV